MDSSLSSKVFAQLAEEIAVQPKQIVAAVELFDGGATVPFIARYRKEATGGMDDGQLRQLEERLVYLRELEERRQFVLKAIEAQGKLTPELKDEISNATTKQVLEDLYAPYKSKRRTRAVIAKEAGIEPLVDEILADENLNFSVVAQKYLNPEKGFETEEAVLNGARDILSERFSLDVDCKEKLREFMAERGYVVSRIASDAPQEASQKFRDYFDFREAFAKAPSHRILALFRGQTEGVLRLSIELSQEEEELSRHPAEELIATYFGIKQKNSPVSTWLSGVCRWTWRVKFRSAVETDLFEILRERAEETAIDIFGDNLRNLLLAAPAGHYGVVGLDPGFRTGVKLAVIDEKGKVLAHDVLMMHTSAHQCEGAKNKLADYIRRYKAKFVAIGNGTASRETSAIVAEVLKADPSLGAIRAIVSEAGASVYSASELAATELPELDVVYRGAVSIARRLQDPLSELVKIEPKAIGVGQYQHDVDPTKLSRRLNAVVEDCVNFVGVDVNTASVELLSYVAGLTRRVAKEIVRFREEKGAFLNREVLKQVPFLGEARFLQSAGFLRIPNGDNPLDASGVHPEAYGVVARIMEKTRISDIRALMGNESVLKSLRAQDFADAQFGIPTVADILKELEKPGRDARNTFKSISFSDAVQTIDDVKVGMELEGVVSNVAAFGAFVDIGVHVDGLVHVSMLADHFVKDPRDVVRVGDFVKVTVIDVDTKRNRISLSMLKNKKASAQKQRKDDQFGNRSTASKPVTAMGAAFAVLHR